MKKSVTSYIPSYCFWDINTNTLDATEDKSFIIPRALYFTDKKSFKKDIEILEKLYSKNEIISELNSTNEIINSSILPLIAKRYLDIELG